MMDRYGEMPGPSKTNAFQEIFTKYKTKINPPISDEKLKELIYESIDNTIEKYGGLGSYAGWQLFISKEVYENTEAKVNQYLSEEPSNSSTCNVLDCFNQISTEQLEQIEYAHQKTKPNFKVPEDLIKEMDEPNKQAAQIMNTQGMDAALAHMTKDLREGKMSYAEMRYYYD